MMKQRFKLRRAYPQLWAASVLRTPHTAPGSGDARPTKHCNPHHHHPKNCNLPLLIAALLLLLVCAAVAAVAAVYIQGSEIIRLYHTLLGPEGFRKGMDLYFKRHDGQVRRVLQAGLKTQHPKTQGCFVWGPGF